MSRNIRWAAFLIALMLAFVAEKKVGAIIFCIENSTNNMICNDQGLDCSCGGSGGGCSSCFHGGGGGGGSSDCVYDWATGDLDCIYSN
jgi:hypothetical protein